MKKTLIALTIVGLFGIGAHTSFADTKCGDPSQSNMTTTYVSCSNGSPEDVVNVWGTKNSELPKVQPGDFITVKNGIKDFCPSFFTTPCVDISHTAYYIAGWN